jgi:branched-subunit amino acid transport protein
MTWVVILAVGAGSYLFRVVPLMVLREVPVGGPAERTIRHAGTAAITALVVLSTRQSATGTGTVPTLLAVASAAVLAGRGASMARLLLVGGSIYAGSVVVGGLLAT